MKKKGLLITAIVILVIAGTFGIVSAVNNRILTYEQAPDTYGDLLTALQGEVTATEKYVQYAAAAQAEGNTAIQRMFLAAAAAERIHVEKEYKIANSMKACEMPQPGEFSLGDSQANLQSCIEGELYESEEMYPAFLQTASNYGFSRAAKVFRYARDAEASHAVMFTAELAQLKETGSTQGDDVYYICPVCGKLEKGSSSAFCPVCGTPGFMFEKF